RVDLVTVVQTCALPIYFRVKQKLFEGINGVRPRVMVLNSDDARYPQLRRIDPSRVISYGMQVAADICPIHHEFGWEGAKATYKRSEERRVGKVCEEKK